MKHNIFGNIKRIVENPFLLLLLVIAVLMVPNVALCFTENYAVLWKAVNILLPAGFYAVFMSASRRTGLMTLFAIPFMILAAFQIVLLYLYGESIIAVDMFLNVATTNIAEVNELLSNLLAAILTVVLLYIPVISLGVSSIVRHKRLNPQIRKKTLLTGCCAAAAGGILALTATFTGTKGEFHRDVFPVNVCCNMAEAVHRTRQTAHYLETSASFTFNAHKDISGNEREIYLFVIGETSRAMNWQMCGYERSTNPRLSADTAAVFCTHAISESNTTHKSVPMLISALTAENFDSIPYCKSIITAMKEAGFHTRFFSNQQANRSYTEFFGNEADDVRYCDFSSATHPYDSVLLDWLSEAVADTVHQRQFIVMHTYGSHFLYRDRYPKEFARFKPDNAITATEANRADLINAYDNTILYTDNLLSDAIEILKSAGCRSAMLYSADHGEDIFDDERGRFLHASPTPTYYQLHVATLVWLSEEVGASDPYMMQSLRRNAMKFVSPQKSLFHTAMRIAHVESPLVDRKLSLVDSCYTPKEAVYLTDLNMAVPLEESGLKGNDRNLLKKILN